MERSSFDEATMEFVRQEHKRKLEQLEIAEKELEVEIRGVELRRHKLRSFHQELELENYMRYCEGKRQDECFDKNFGDADRKSGSEDMESIVSAIAVANLYADRSDRTIRICRESGIETQLRAGVRNFLTRHGCPLNDENVISVPALSNSQDIARDVDENAPLLISGFLQEKYDKPLEEFDDNTNRERASKFENVKNRHRIRVEFGKVFKEHWLRSHPDRAGDETIKADDITENGNPIRVACYREIDRPLMEQVANEHFDWTKF